MDVWDPVDKYVIKRGYKDAVKILHLNPAANQMEQFYFCLIQVFAVFRVAKASWWERMLRRLPESFAIFAEMEMSGDEPCLRAKKFFPE